MFFWKLLKIIWSARFSRPRGLKRVRWMKRELRVMQKDLEALSEGNPSPGLLLSFLRKINLN